MAYNEDADKISPFPSPLPPGPTVLDISHQQIKKEYYELTGKIHPAHMRAGRIGGTAAVAGAALLATCIIIVCVCWRRRRKARKGRSSRSKEKRVSIDHSSSEEGEGSSLLKKHAGQKLAGSGKKWYQFRRKDKMVPSSSARDGDQSLSSQNRGQSSPSPHSTKPLQADRKHHILRQKRSSSLDERAYRRW